MSDFYFKPDAARAFTGNAPFSVVPGRGVVDAHGRLILQTIARRAVTRDGVACEEWEGLAIHPADADSNAHAIGAILNNPAAYLAQWIERRVSLEPDAARREWLRRQLGNVRKIATEF